ncbi:MAG: TonB-dependent receptor family protein [Muribaculaceae bacterium]|nr:TonB-dependent receptor family protein [Muribaculaceae bacterium]
MKRIVLKRLFCAALVTLTCLVAVAQDFSGDWKGNIQVQTYTIPLVLHIQQNDEGMTATLDSPQQQAYGIKAKASVKDGKLTVEVPEIGASYKATLKDNTLDGNYSQMGFSIPLKLSREVPVTADNDDEDWVNDSLLNVFDNIQLEGIEVTAQRQLIKQEVDRIGYNVAEDADSKTNNVLTMLRKVPMVSVDASDEIRINGQQNFKIFRNGHPDPSLSRNAKDILKAMPASSVKRIEVITEPGAKYDAEGTTMILNIVMADNSTLKGVSGMASARADHKGAVGGSLNMTTQLDKVVLAVDYGIHHDGNNGQGYRSSSVNNYTQSGAQLLSDTKFDADKVTVHFADVSASWEPDTLNLLSWSLSGFAYDYAGNGVSNNMMQNAGNLLYSYGMGNHTKANSYNFDTRMDYQRSTHRKGETITLSYMLSSFRNKNKDNSRYTESVNMPVTYYGIDQDGKENFNEHTIQLDWTRPLTEKHKLETGAKYIYRLNRSHNMLDYLGIDDDTDMRYKHVTQVGAAYLSYTFHNGPWDARAGLRYEHSYLRATYPDGQQDAYEAHLNDFVPSASLRYQFNFANSLKLSYAASINRPGISYLNPAVIETPTSRSYGNTDLGSVHYHSVSLTYMRVGPKLTFNITPQFQFSNNGIGAVKWADGLVQVSTYANTLKTYSTTVSAFVQWMLTQKTNLMLNGSIGYNYYKSKELGLKNDRVSGNFFANVTQFLPWKLQLSGFAGMWGGGITDLYGRIGTVFFHGFSLQRSFLKEDRLTVQLQAVVPFGGKYMSMKSYITQGDVTGWTRYEQQARRFGINISYRFGSLTTRVKKADKSIENDDLIGSGKQSGNTGGATGGMGGGN